MKTEIIQTLLFCAVPLGIVLLINGIKLLKKKISSPIIIELPYQQNTETFKINESGKYAIWHIGDLFKKNHVNQFKPDIANMDTGEKIQLQYSVLRTHVNGFEK